MAIDLTQVDSIINKHGAGRGELIAVLIDIQEALSWLPPESLGRVAEKMGFPALRVFQVAHFYNMFRFKPPGKHVISVCSGTACYAHDGPSLLREIGRLLHVKPGEATEDGQFTLEAVNCPGNCPAGPVMLVDGTPHGRVDPNQLDRLLKPYKIPKEAARE